MHCYKHPSQCEGFTVPSAPPLSNECQLNAKGQGETERATGWSMPPMNYEEGFVGGFLSDTWCSLVLLIKWPRSYSPWAAVKYGLRCPGPFQSAEYEYGRERRGPGHQYRRGDTTLHTHNTTLQYTVWRAHIQWLLWRTHPFVCKQELGIHLGGKDTEWLVMIQLFLLMLITIKKTMIGEN